MGGEGKAGMGAKLRRAKSNNTTRMRTSCEIGFSPEEARRLSREVRVESGAGKGEPELAKGSPNWNSQSEVSPSWNSPSGQKRAESALSTSTRRMALQTPERSFLWKPSRGLMS